MRYFSAYALSLKKHLSCGHGVYAYYGAADRGFAAARFANEGERFPFVYIEAHVLNRAELLAVQLEINVKIAHGHKLFAV